MPYDERRADEGIRPDSVLRLLFFVGADVPIGPPSLTPPHPALRAEALLAKEGRATKWRGDFCEKLS